MKETGSYINGQLNGIVKTYSINGVLKSEEKFQGHKIFSLGYGETFFRRKT